MLFPGLSTLPSPGVRVILEVRVYFVEPATAEPEFSLLVLLAVLVSSLYFSAYRDPGGLSQRPTRCLLTSTVEMAYHHPTHALTQVCPDVPSL